MRKGPRGHSGLFGKTLAVQLMAREHPSCPENKQSPKSLDNFSAINCTNNQHKKVIAITGRI